MNNNESPTMRAKYEAWFRNKEMDAYNATGMGTKDFSGPLAPGVGREAIDSAVKRGEVDLQGNAIKSQASDAAGKTNTAAIAQGGQMATNAAAQGDSMGTLGGGLVAAGGMTANPYLMAGGLGLSVLGAGEANKRKQEEAQRQAYNERIRNRQEIMMNIGRMGIQ